MEIPKTTSVPHSHGLISFLDLPPEIRKYVYELMFERDKPVLIHSTHHEQAPPAPKNQSPRPITEEEYKEIPTIAIGEGESTVTQHGWILCGDPDESSESEEYNQNKLEADKALERFENEELDLFHNGFSHALGLLASCRQVYQESAGVLYGNNTFEVSRIRTRDDYSYDSIYDQLDHTPVRLRSLGTQYGLLKRVTIDTFAVQK